MKMLELMTLNMAIYSYFHQYLYLRYLELVHPIWHRVNFKTRWVYIAFALIWLCNLLNETYQIATSKVRSGVFIIYLYNCVHQYQHNKISCT